MRIVIDTNVIASAVFFGGRPAQLVRLLLEGRLEACVSPEIIDEYQDTIAELCGRYPQRNPRVALSWIIAKCDVIDAVTEIHVCRDPDDDKFIDCAVSGQCILITTGDKDLLSLKEYNGIKIITVSEFFKDYWSEG